MKRRPNTQHHKAIQLCQQIRWALDYAINERLEPWEAVMVADVVPCPNTSHMLVLVEPLESVSFESMRAIEEKLCKQSGALRTEAARAISRRKTPSLTFRVRPAGVLGDKT